MQLEYRSIDAWYDMPKHIALHVLRELRYKRWGRYKKIIVYAKDKRISFPACNKQYIYIHVSNSNAGELKKTINVYHVRPAKGSAGK